MSAGDEARVREELAETAALVAVLRGADTPFRAWAAVVMRSGADPRYRAEGKMILREFADAMPEVLEHGDLAAFALLAGDLLTLSQRDQLRAHWPAPNHDRSLRSRFYDSPTLVYLAARGLGSDLPDAPGIVRLVESEVRILSSRPAPSVPSLLLRMATLLELRSGNLMPEDLPRLTAGRILSAEGDAAAATAARWFLERYDADLTGGMIELRTILERMAADFAGDVRELAEADPAVCAMALETQLTRYAGYELTLADAVARAVSARIGPLRHAAAAALAVIALALPAVPIGYAARANLLSWISALVGGLCLGVPLALWSILWAYGRPRRLDGFGAAIFIGFAYYSLALVAGAWSIPKLRSVVEGDSLMSAVSLAVIAALFVGLQESWGRR